MFYLCAEEVNVLPRDMQKIFAAIYQAQQIHPEIKNILQVEQNSTEFESALMKQSLQKLVVYGIINLTEKEFIVEQNGELDEFYYSPSNPWHYSHNTNMMNSFRDIFLTEIKKGDTDG